MADQKTNDSKKAETALPARINFTPEEAACLRASAVLIRESMRQYIHQDIAAYPIDSEADKAISGLVEKAAALKYENCIKSKKANER